MICAPFRLSRSLAFTLFALPLICLPAVAEVSALSIQLREAVSAHITPTPFYEEKVIPGPVPLIGLPQDRTILVVPAG